MSIGLIEDVPSLPTSEALYEMVGGRPVEKPMGAYEVHLANRLFFAIGQFVFARDLGWVEAEMLFDFGQQDQPHRRPDVAYVSHGRWPKGVRIPSARSWAVVPDLAIEVVSPTDPAIDIEAKVVEYFEAGVRLVWVVYPATERVYRHESLEVVHVVTRQGELDGGAVLPGFRLAVASLFEFASE